MKIGSTRERLRESKTFSDCGSLCLESRDEKVVDTVIGRKKSYRKFPVRSRLICERSGNVRDEGGSVRDHHALWEVLVQAWDLKMNLRSLLENGV